jgi:hypothetical protein
MHATFTTAELLGIFREGLVALIPVAERARIPWRGPATYDPWEDIARILFESIVASVVENSVPTPPRPLPRYGVAYGSYADLSFFTERAARLRGEQLVFSALATVKAPFDTMRLLEVDAAFVPTGRTVDIPLLLALPELAARDPDGLRYCDVIEYDE